MIIRELGKIKAASFGWGGYQDCMVGLSLTFGGQSWGVSDFIGWWGTSRSDTTEWSEEDRLRRIGEAGMKLAELLKACNGRSVEDLLDKPVEVTFEANKLVSWRLLVEVL